MAILKQSTAYTRMFLMVQSADHVSALTGAAPTVTLSKAGAAFGGAGGSVTEVSGGWYKIALNTTDTGTLGDLAYHITAASGDNTDFVDQVSANLIDDVPASVLTTQMTESYAADGTAPTAAQSLFLIQQLLSEFAISGTTMTVKKINGSTTAATMTLDSATSPTSITRAT